MFKNLEASLASFCFHIQARNSVALKSLPSGTVYTAAPAGTASSACGADRWSPLTGKPASPLRRVGIETDEFCFVPEGAAAAGAVLAEVVL